jgi:hypothetical protein
VTTLATLLIGVVIGWSGAVIVFVLGAPKQGDRLELPPARKRR